MIKLNPKYDFIRSDPPAGKVKVYNQYYDDSDGSMRFDDSPL